MRRVAARRDLPDNLFHDGKIYWFRVGNKKPLPLGTDQHLAVAKARRLNLKLAEETKMSPEEKTLLESKTHAQLEELWRVTPTTDWPFNNIESAQYFDELLRRVKTPIEVRIDEIMAEMLVAAQLDPGFSWGDVEGLLAAATAQAQTEFGL